jgi:hypothetical protein
LPVALRLIDVDLVLVTILVAVGYVVCALSCVPYDETYIDYLDALVSEPYLVCYDLVF